MTAVAKAVVAKVARAAVAQVEAAPAVAAQVGAAQVGAAQVRVAQVGVARAEVAMEAGQRQLLSQRPEYLHLQPALAAELTAVHYPSPPVGSRPSMQTIRHRTRVGMIR